LINKGSKSTTIKTITTKRMNTPTISNFFNPGLFCNLYNKMIIAIMLKKTLDE
jgi:hypothetical protein